MIIHNIKITNFKSIYDTQEFNFDKLEGLIKLSGPIGTGKTTLGESILYGLYGSVKGQNNPGLVSWNCKSCEVEINLTSKGRNIHIIRNSKEPLIVEVNGKTLAASNKRDTQSILEEDLYDVPKLAVQKMCVISFNAFNSLATMSPAETKQFLDEVFGFKLFTEYNEEIVIERKNQQNESIKLNAIYSDTVQQIEYLNKKKTQQRQEVENSIDIEGLNKKREEYVFTGKEKKQKYLEIDNSYKEKENKVNTQIQEYYNKKMEYATFGKQEKGWLEKFKNGICPTCGNKINEDVIEEHKTKMYDYAAKYKEQEAEEKKLRDELSGIKEEHSGSLKGLNDEMQDLKTKINQIDSEIMVYNNNLKVINENYDDLIKNYEDKAKQVKSEIDKIDIEIGEWNDMTELFSKTLRYKLLENLIPHINKSIKYYINKLDQPYNIEYDQEFKPHISIETFDKEISYNNLSTGQKKSLDMAIIFGVLQNIIANVDFNIFFLDELFSNLDSDSRNTMLGLLKDSLSKNRTIFVINHAEMCDDYFTSKIRVSLENKKIMNKKKEQVIVKSSKYSFIWSNL